MKKLILALVLVIGCSLLGGCGKQCVFTPHPTELQTVLDRETHTFIAQTQPLEMMVGFPKEFSGGDFEALIGVGNTSDSSIWVSPYNVKVYSGHSEPDENPIEVLAFDDLQTGVKIKNFFDKLAIGTVVGVALVGAAASGHHYETSTFSGTYTGPDYGQGGTFVGSITTHYYDPEENRRNVESVAAAGGGILSKTKARCANRYAALAAEYMCGQRLEPGYSFIKKIVVKGIKVADEPQLINTEIQIEGITRKFVFLLAPKGKTQELSVEPVESVVEPEKEMEQLKQSENQSAFNFTWWRKDNANP